MNPSHIDEQPISEAELKRLEDILHARSDDESAMNLEMLDGYLTALVVGPDLVSLDEYLPPIFGGDPKWASVDEAREALDLLMKFWNHIVWRLDRDLEPDPDGNVPGLLGALPFIGWPEPEEPAETDDAEAPTEAVSVADIFADAPEDFPIGAIWSLGFLEGMGLRESQWRAWIHDNETIADAVVQILSLSQIENEESDVPADEPIGPLGLIERLSVIEALPIMLQTVNDLRVAELKAKPRTGRNDPCPCGSGKKFKKCCGAPDTLH